MKTPDSDEGNPNYCCCPRRTYCDGDRVNNVWIEGGNRETGEGGVCLLDNLTQDQVIYCVERDETARKDLKRVTHNPELLNLAETTPRLSTLEPMDVEQSEINNNNFTCPYYQAFRGQPPYAQ